MNKLNDMKKKDYEFPAVEIVKFSCTDILTESSVGDEDQGEWDPQLVSDL